MTTSTIQDIIIKQGGWIISVFAVAFAVYTYVSVPNNQAALERALIRKDIEKITTNDLAHIQDEMEKLEEKLQKQNDQIIEIDKKILLLLDRFNVKYDK